MKKTISIMTEEFVNEKTGESVEGITIMIDGVIKYLFDKHHQTTSLCIIGFTIGSVFVLFPGFAHGILGLICYPIFFVSLILSHSH